MSYLERIRRLRDRAVSPKICYHEFWLNFYRVYDGNNYGDAFYHAMDALTPVIEDDELIVGRTVPCLSPEDAAEWETRVKPVAQQYSWKAGSGQDSHMAVDYDLLLREGIDGILAKIAAYREKNGASEFYDTCKYRPRCPTCTVFRSHQNGEGAPPSRKGDPPASRDSRREFSTAIAARSAGDASSSTVVNCRRDRKPRVSEPTRSSFSFPPPLPPSSRAAHA